MTRYSVQPRYRIFLKDYWFLPFTKNMGKKITSQTENDGTKDVQLMVVSKQYLENS